MDEVSQLIRGGPQRVLSIPQALADAVNNYLAVVALVDEVLGSAERLGSNTLQLPHTNH